MSRVPFPVTKVDEDTNKQLLRDFRGESRYFVQAGPSKFLLPSRFAEEAEDFYNFKMRPDDIWINTYARSGTTLTQELIWMVANKCDFETSNKISLVQRFPMIEGNLHGDARVLAEAMKEAAGDPVKEAILKKFEGTIIEELDQIDQGETRFIKTHLGFTILPPNLLDTCKVVYVARHPKDVVVSYYHWNKMHKMLGYIGDFPTFYDYFERGLVQFSPFWEHIKEAWALKDHPNMLFLFYEDIIKDLGKTIRMMADFLGKTLSDAQVEALAAHLHIDKFRANLSVNPPSHSSPGLINKDNQGFVRKGEVGSWKKEGFTPELSARADEWIAKNIAQIPGFSFPQN